MPKKKSNQIVTQKEAKNITETQLQSYQSPDINIVDEAKNMLKAYIDEEKIKNFSLIPENIKLTLLQKTPTRFIKERELSGGKIFHYVDHQFSKKALNFAFNFDVSNEPIKEEYFTYEETYKDYKDPRCTKSSQGKIIPIDKIRTVTEAECTMRFTINRENGKTTIRTVKSSHKGYANPATTRGDIMQSAFSKSWTKVAHTFGIGSELEDDLYVNPKPEEKIDSNFIDGDEVEAPASNEKAFKAW